MTTETVVNDPLAARFIVFACSLFADDLDAIADQLDRAFARTHADQMRTNRRLDRQNQAVLPF